MMNLEVELFALLDKPLYEKIDRPGLCEYHFMTISPNRKLVCASKGLERNDSSQINLGYGVKYDSSKIPHILVV